MVPRAANNRFADRRGGHRELEVLLQPVAALRLEKDDRVVEGDRRAQQRICVRRRARRHDRQARGVRVVRLGTLGVMLDGADTAAVGDADHHRQADASPGPVAVFRDVADHLVEGRVGEAVKLHLYHRAQPVDRHADGRADDPRLRDRGVEAAVDAHLRLQTVTDPEDTAQLADVLAVDHHGVVLAHRVAQRGVECSRHRELHQEVSSAAVSS